MTTHRHTALGISATRERLTRPSPCTAISPELQVSTSTIFVAANDVQAQLVIEGLAAERTHIHRVENVSAIAPALAHTRADAAIIVSERSGPDVTAALHAIRANQPLAVALFVARGDQDEIDSAIAAGASALIVDGLQTHRIASLLQVALCRFKLHEALRSELEQARSDLAARKAIERAKGILMARRGLTEPDAYAMLRRSAMQDGRTISAIAEAIIAADRLLTA